VPTDQTSLSQSVLRFLRFVAAGGIATLVTFVCSYAFLNLGAQPWISNLSAFAIAFVVGYTLQRFWTFGARHAHGRALPRYLILQIGVALLTALVGQVGGHFGAPHIVIALGSAIFSGGLCFAGTSLWVFADSAAEPRAGAPVG
jgi:putative flippase GtrA